MSILGFLRLLWSHIEIPSPQVDVYRSIPVISLSFEVSKRMTLTPTTTMTTIGGGGGGKFCGACSNQLRGYGFMSAGGKSSFHPCCLHLDRFIEVNGEKLMLNTKNISLKCNWCKTMSIRARRAVTPSWSYVLVGKDRRFHVGCIQDMMRESWRDGGIDQPMRAKQEDDTTNLTTCLSLEIKLPIDPEEERDADPLGSVAQKVADLITKNFRGSGNNPLATAMADQATMMEVLGDSLGALTRGAGSGSSQLWKVTRVLWRLLLLKIRQSIAWPADTLVGHAGRTVWTAASRPSMLWELIRPLLR
ncbi:hypothetical protein ACJRO7_016491 [Eucalyptus globulus]|uniref:Uncharacterized protein n=1 Tax=Eucalyptus globulus TaxID=34317 RepID=A0ABD3L774_EUCGL